MVLMQALGQGPVRAGAAHCVLSRLLDREQLAEGQIAECEGLTARMQGLQRLSVMLHPAYQEGEAEQAAIGDAL